MVLAAAAMLSMGAVFTQPAFAERVGAERLLLGAAQANPVKPGDTRAQPTTSSGYADLIAKHARENGVPVRLARAVVRIESNFNARARGRAGEVGLMQIKLASARAMGYSGNASALYHPDTNLRYGMKYLGIAHSMANGDVCGTIMRYNGGHYATRMTSVSRGYCRKVMAMLA